MIEELNHLENIILEICKHKISYLKEDEECVDYFGFNFKIDNLKIKFRKAKITPTKVGQFVTLWKRNSENKTEPFSENDPFDYYFIATKQDNKFGLFLFPRLVLCEKQIISTSKKEGKRGFRLYPNWTKTDNKQAEKTQLWQIKYFIDLTNFNSENIQKMKMLLRF